MSVILTDVQRFREVKCSEKVAQRGHGRAGIHAWCSVEVLCWAGAVASEPPFLHGPEWPWAQEKSARALQGVSEAAALGLGVGVRAPGPPAAHTCRAGSPCGRGDSWVCSCFGSQQGSSWARTLRRLRGQGCQLLLQVVGTLEAGARGARRSRPVVLVSRVVSSSSSSPLAMPTHSNFKAGARGPRLGAPCQLPQRRLGRPHTKPFTSHRMAVLLPQRDSGCHGPSDPDLLVHHAHGESVGEGRARFGGTRTLRLGETRHVLIRVLR